MDSACELLLQKGKGFLFPDFVLNIISGDFEVIAEKKFAGGSSRERMFNYQVLITIVSHSQQILDQLLHGYRKCGPRPLLIIVD